MVDARGYFGGDRGVGGGEPTSKRGEARLPITLVAFRCHRRRRSSSERATSSHVQVVWLSLPKFVFFFFRVVGRSTAAFFVLLHGHPLHSLRFVGRLYIDIRCGHNGFHRLVFPVWAC